MSNKAGYSYVQFTVLNCGSVV